jgi:hypothetical protein
MDGVMGIVYLPALKLPSSVTAGAGASSSTSPTMPAAAIASPTGPRRGRLFIVDRSAKEVEEEEDKGYDRYGNAVAKDEDDEELSGGGGRSKTRRRTRGESYGPQLVGFVIVLLALLFVLDFFGEAGWGLVMLGFLPRLASLFDRHVVHRRFI